MTTSKKSKKEQTRRALSKSLIIEGAVRLADDIGVNALTIRKLATALDVKPMTIYYYVPNKETIIDAMAVPLMESRQSPGPDTLKHHDAVIGCLRKGGLSVELTAHAYALLDAFIYGFAIQEANLPATTGDDMHELVENVVDSMPMGDYPYLMELTNEHILKPGYNFSNEFEFGLNVILDGLDSASK